MLSVTYLESRKLFVRKPVPSSQWNIAGASTSFLSRVMSYAHRFYIQLSIVNTES